MAKTDAGSPALIKSVAEFTDEIAKSYKPEDTVFFYRGQPKDTAQIRESYSGDQLVVRTTGILPAILRPDCKAKESEIYNHVMTECAQEFDGLLSHVEILSKMQHYGVPTRLLDVTTNALSALYFACSDEYGQPNDGNNSIVNIFKAAKADIKSFDSDTIAILTSLPRFEEEVKKEIKERAKQAKDDFKAFNEDEHKDEDKRYVRKLLHEVKKERPAFEDIIRPKHLLRSFFCIPRKNNVRIIRQHGAFIVFGLTEEVPVMPDKIFIKNDSKKAILDELKSLGVFQSTLFPELYQVAIDIRNRCKSAKAAK